MRRSILISSVVAVLLLAGFAVRLYLQTEQRKGLELAQFMPSGALAYFEARNLKALLAQWVNSGSQERYLATANWAVFQQSRLYLKVRERTVPIETALGFELTLQELEKLAGARSAFAIYNIGELEAVFITEIDNQKALALELFKQRAKFRQRSAEGIVYYVREGSDEEARRKVTAGFAHVQGKLVLASSETILRRVLANLRATTEDQLETSISRFTGPLADFTPHDLTVWLDQKRLNGDRYFKNYWIHDNLEELREIESAVIDLELAGEEFRERRWFGVTQTDQDSAVTIASMNDLVRFAPPGAQLVSVASPKNPKALGQLAERTLLGPSPLPFRPQLDDNIYPSDSQEPYDRSESVQTDRYAFLDARFNKDIDDPTSFAGSIPPQPSQVRAGVESSQFVEQVVATLGPAQPQEVMVVGEASVGDNKLFVSFSRAIIVKLGKKSEFKPGEFEKAVGEEFTRRYTVSGTPYQLDWRAAGEVRSLNQGLVDRGGAYAVVGDFLVLADRADYCARVVQAYRGPPVASQNPAHPLERFARVSIRHGKPTYDHLFGMLAVPSIVGESNVSIDLFSNNIGGLLEVAPNLKTVSIEAARNAPILRETAVYQFDAAAQPKPTGRE